MYPFSTGELKITYCAYLIGLMAILDATAVYDWMPAVVVVEITQHIPNRRYRSVDNCTADQLDHVRY